MNIRVFAESDHIRIETLLREYRPFLHSEVLQMAALRQRLADAVIVPDDRLSASIAALDDCVDLLDASDRSHRRYRLVLPWDADVARDRLSILSPLGGGVLGLKEGSVVEVETPREGDPTASTFILMQVTRTGTSEIRKRWDRSRTVNNNQERLS